jgi:hypothetical protein
MPETLAGRHSRPAVIFQLSTLIDGDPSGESRHRRPRVEIKAAIALPPALALANDHFRIWRWLLKLITTQNQ